MLCYCVKDIMCLLCYSTVSHSPYWTVGWMAFLSSSVPSILRRPRPRLPSGYQSTTTLALSFWQSSVVAVSWYFLYRYPSAFIWEYWCFIASTIMGLYKTTTNETWIVISTHISASIFYPNNNFVDSQMTTSIVTQNLYGSNLVVSS